MGIVFMGLVFVYVFIFDFFKCWGYSNVEFVLVWFWNFFGVKYLLYIFLWVFVFDFYLISFFLVKLLNY